jgi:hypothetical protein
LWADRPARSGYLFDSLKLIAQVDQYGIAYRISHNNGSRNSYLWPRILNGDTVCRVVWRGVGLSDLSNHSLILSQSNRLSGLLGPLRAEWLDSRRVELGSHRWWETQKRLNRLRRVTRLPLCPFSAYIALIPSGDHVNRHVDPRFPAVA